MTKSNASLLALLELVFILCTGPSSQGQNAPAPGQLQVIFRPRAAVSAGAGWRLPGDTAYHTGTAPVPVAPGTYLLEYQPLDLFSPPPRQAVTVRSGRLSPVAATYGSALGDLPKEVPDLQLSANGAIHALARQENGDLLVGGRFLSINGAPRHNLARVHPDGSVDLTWAPEPDDAVLDLLVSGNRVYAAGTFWRIGAAVRPALAQLELNGSGAVVPGFNAQVYPIVTNGSITSPDRAVVSQLVLSPRGLFVHGDFLAIGGVGGFRTNRQPAAKLNPVSGRADANWTVRYRGDQRRSTWALAGAGDLLFASVDEGLLRLSPVTGTTYPGWKSTTDASSTLKVGSDAAYGIVGHQVKKFPVALNGSADPAWAPDLGSNSPLQLTIVADGYLYLTTYVTVGGSTQDATLRRVRESDGVVDPTWQVSAPDGPALATPEGVVVPSPNGDAAAPALVLNRFGTATAARDTSFQVPTGDEGYLQTFAVTPAGEIILSSLVGPGLRSAGQPVCSLPRFKADGSVDTAWQVKVDGPVQRLLVDNGYLYLAGKFTHVGNLARHGLARLSLSGSGEPDAAWDPVGARDLSLEFTTILQSTGGYVFFNAGAPFARASSLYRAPVTAGGTIDSNWNSGLATYDRFVSLDSGLVEGGLLYVSGAFQRTDSNGHFVLKSFLRIDPAQGVDTQWQAPVLNSSGVGLPLATDGAYLYFVAPAPAPQAQIGRCALATGALDTHWRAVANGTISTLAVSRGALYAGGTFTSIGGAAGTGVGRLPLANAGHADRTFNFTFSGERNLLTLYGAVNLLLPFDDTLFVLGSFSSVSGRPLVDFAALPLP